MDEDELDTLLAVIGNPTRRRILRKLVKETHYPLQLSKELSVSQQAIMRHLEVLEKNDLVRSGFRKSDTGGPPRRYYEATKSLTIVIDLSPELFSESLRLHDSEGRVIEAASDSTALGNADNLRLRLAELSNAISVINSRLRDLAEERDGLISQKEEALFLANRIVDTLCDDYTERKVLRYLISEDDLSLEVMAEKMNMREREIEKVMRKLEDDGLVILGA